MSLTWGDVDFEHRRVILQKTKNGERRAVPLAGHALAALEAHWSGRELVGRRDLLFPGNANPSRPMHMRKAWVKALEDAAIEDFRFHDLRHSAASYLAMSGASLAEIAEVLGHKTLAMVKRYAHLSEGHTASVVERMAAKFS